MIRNSAILLDSCIINNLGSKEKSLNNITFKLLERLASNNNELYISEFTYYETLRGASDTKRQTTEKSINSYFKKVPQNKDRLERAIKLYSAYQRRPEIKNFLNSISDIDVFIGSLIFTKQKPLLLTADFCDFPRPLFKEKDYVRIEYTKKRHNKTCQYYYFLEANLEALFNN